MTISIICFAVVLFFVIFLVIVAIATIVAEVANSCYFFLITVEFVTVIVFFF